MTDLTANWHVPRHGMRDIITTAYQMFGAAYTVDWRILLRPVDGGML